MRKLVSSESALSRPRVVAAILATITATAIAAFVSFASSPSGEAVSPGSSQAASDAGSAPNAAADCVNAPTQVVSDPAGDQGAGNPEQVDILSVAVGEDYRFSDSERLVFQIKVVNLNTVPPNEFWRVRFTVTPAGGTATVYQVSMTSDANSVVNYEYGTLANSQVTTLGGIEDGFFTNDGLITMAIARNKVGNPAPGQTITAVSGLTQRNNGGLLFTGQDSTSSAPYTIRPKSAACTQVTLPPPPGTANYTKGGITFSPNYTVRAPYIGQDVEPSIRTDKFGNTYVAGIRGLTGGTDLWYFDLRPTVNGAPNPKYDPLMRNPQYRGQPDSITGSEDVVIGADGGGDVDMAVGFNSEATEDPNAPPILAYSSLVLSNISTQRSTDRGVTFVANPAGNITGGVPGDDRQWMEFLGNNTVYILYRTLAPAVTQIQRSLDGGLTYGPAKTAGPIGQVGGIDVDQNDGTVYISGSTGSVAVGIPPAAGVEPLTYTVYNVAGPGKNHIFFTVKVASDGTAYACYSDDKNIFVKYTKNKGATWSPAIRVSDGAETLTSVFPWLETGPTPGTIGVVWYGTAKSLPSDDSADWHLFYAIGTDVTGATPNFQQVRATDHVLHAANISESGLVVGGQSPNRNLADYFQVSFDPAGAAVITYTDDHNDFSGHVYVTRQISGPGVNSGAPIPAPVEGSALPAPAFQPLPTAESVGGIPGSQVTDFRRDVRSGGNPGTGGSVVVPTDDPVDIVSVKYSLEGTSAAPIVVATMKVSDLTTIPPSTNWRMTLSANAPDSVLSPTGEYTFGIGDRGDPFFVRATTDASGAQTFVYGTLKRNFDGSITYTDVGAADAGSGFDQVNKTITVKVVVSKLNAALAAGRPQLVLGTILSGLRASTFTTVQGSGNNRTDTARGGTQFQISFPVPLTSVVSRKTHTGVGDFDVDLPLTGTRGVECRTGGANGDHDIVFTFAAPVVAGTATCAGNVAGTTTVGNEITVHCTGITNAQTIAISLNGASVQMGVLLGDTNADTFVNSADIGQTKSRSGQVVGGSNFRSDVTVDGNLNSADIGLVKSKSGTALPP